MVTIMHVEKCGRLGTALRTPPFNFFLRFIYIFVREKRREERGGEGREEERRDLLAGSLPKWP